MNINKELNNIISQAYMEAKTRKHEFLTPEHVLYSALGSEEGKTLIKTVGGSPQRLKKSLEQFFNDQMPKVEDEEPVQSLAFKNVMERAFLHVVGAEKPEMDLGDVLASLLLEKDSFAAHFLLKEGITRIDILNFISHGSSAYDANGGGGEEAAETAETGDEDEEEEEGEPGPRRKVKRVLEAFTVDLTEKARRGEIDPLIGREDVLERTIQVLSRRLKNNPVHVGEPGVGKTAVTEGLAQMIVDGRVPKALADYRIFALDMGSVLAGTKYRGDFEDRMKKVLNELLKMDKVILFIDEIHSVVGAGAVSGGGSMDASTILKPVLTSGKLRCIGSTTYEDYRKYFDRDRALTRRFQKIEISEPTVDETYKILAGLKDRYEEHHGLTYSDEALHAAAELSAKYINDRYLPDKAIDVIDEAGAYVKLFKEAAGENGRPVITAADIERVVAKIAKIPEKSVSHTEGVKLMDLERELKSMIFGQDKAIELVVHAIKRSRAGFHKPDKPVASLLFVGPTGVGKTELARQLAAFMGVPLHRFDMSEYQEKHTVSRLVGAPPGYVGYDEGGLLTEAVRKNPHSVLLLDEIEKAHQDIFNTLLQVFDYATLTDNNGKKADFRNVIVIMTSNAGAREIGKPLVGFGDRNVAKDAIDYAVENIFSPEFRNRLDAVVTFNNLNDEIMRMIVRKEIREFQAQLVEKKVTLEVDDEAVAWLAAKGFSSLYGAREVARLFQDKVKNYFVDAVLFGALASGGTALVSVKDDDIAIESRPLDPSTAGSSLRSQRETPGTSPSTRPEKGSDREAPAEEAGTPPGDAG